MKKRILLLLILSVLVSSVAFAFPHVKEGNGVYVQNADFKVKAIDETIYCTNVWSNDGCLFKGTIEVTSRSNNNYNVKPIMDYNKQVKFKSVKDRGRKISKSLNKNNGKNFQGSFNKINKGTTEIIDIEFYSWESGKYNYTIEYNGQLLTLDPFFNITYNTSTPSLHLINGTTNTVNDTNYTTTNEISSELGDESDATFFETSTITDTIAYYRFEEGSGSTAIDSSGNGLDGTNFGSPVYVSSKGGSGTGTFAMNFDGTNDEVIISDSSNDFQFGNGVTDEPFSMTAWVNMADATQFRIAQKFEVSKEFIWTVSNTDNMLILVQDQSSGGTLDKRTSATLTTHEGAWLHVAFTYDGSGSSSGLKLYLNGTLQAMSDNSAGGYTAMEDTGIDFRIGGENSGQWSDGQIDELAVFDHELTSSNILDIVDNGIPVSAKAIKPNFDVTLDSGNSYWLRTKKITPGVHTGNVYLYDTNVSINNLTLDTASINTGWDVIPLSNSIINGENATFRFFTDDVAKFSEIQLIEGINDTVNPSIINQVLNNSVIVCNDTVRMSVNVTDDNAVMDVNITYIDHAGSHSVIADKIINTDIYFVDVMYTHTQTPVGHFNFTGAIASDLAGNMDSASFTETFTYTCLGIDITPPVITPSVTTNNTLIDKRITNKTVNYSIFDNEEIKNSTWTVFNTSQIIITSDIVLNASTMNYEVFDIVDITNVAPGDYFINRVAYDTSNNSASYLQAFTIVDFDLLVTLISPDNNSQATLQAGANDHIGLEFQAIGAESCNMYINDSFFTDLSSFATPNIFDIGLTYPYPVDHNQTIKWNVECSFIGDINVNSSFRVVDLELIPQPEDYISIGDACMLTNLTGVGIMFMLFIMSLGIMIFSITIRNGLVGGLGAVLLLLESGFMWTCSSLFALFLGAIALLLMSFFVIKGFKGNL